MWKRTSLGTISYKMTCWTTVEGVWSFTWRKIWKGTWSDLSRGIQRKGHSCSIFAPTLMEMYKWRPISCAKHRSSERHHFWSADVIQTGLSFTLLNCRPCMGSVYIWSAALSLLLYLMDLFPRLSFISSLLFNWHSPLSPPPWKPHLSSTPSPVSSPPSAWVWLSSLYRGRWGHKTAGEARGGPRDKVCTWLIIPRMQTVHAYT